ncbi:MAG: tRNA (adenosine(37)-N6)-dimethylallyltransferase MiaA [Thiomicrospira sp.]|jgi:tRNA dimethylallyltransferase|nr:tRNA (adenosine(37)-N6)-dimethylallyltransferase MiaA [Thiomicrospira sp.]
MLTRLLETQTVLAIMGPTASGKTRLALGLAEHLPMEIISVDSALIYRGMDIGTAKPSAQELSAVPHHLIDILDPAQTYSVSQFVADTNRLIADIWQRQRVPVLVGGTMMYFHALQQGLADLPSADADLREDLLMQYHLSPHALHQRLQQVDPLAAARIHPNDPQRLVRALEVYALTGKALSDLQQTQHQTAAALNWLKVGLIPRSRETLHQAIKHRLETMFKAGFLDEVRGLYQRGDLHEDLPSIRSVGYRQAWLFLKGELDEQSWQEKALIATRQLAKRQLTWLRKEQGLHQLDPFAYNDAQKQAWLFELIDKNLNQANQPYGIL